MRIQKRIVGIFCIALITAACFFYFYYHNYKHAAENSSELIQTQEVLKDIDSTFFSTINLESNTKSFVLTGSAAFEQEALASMAVLTKLKEKFKAFSATNAEEKMLVSGVIENITQKLRFESEIIQANKTSHKKAMEILAGMDDRFITGSLKQFLMRLQDTYSRQRIAILEESKSISKANLRSTVVIGVFTLILFGIIIMQVNRYMQFRTLSEKEARLKEIKYSRFVEESGLVLLTTDLKGNISFVNKRVSHFIGFEPAEIIGKHFSLLVEDEWVPVINSNFKKQIQTKEFELQIEFPLKVKSGKPIWVEQSSIILYSNGKPNGFQCIVKDITERKKLEIEAKKVEQEREENQYRLQSILDNTTLIVYIKDLDGRYLLVNKKYKDIYQFTDEQAIGKTDFDLLPKAEAVRNYEVDQYVIREQRTIEMEEEIVSQSEGALNLLLVRFPLFDKNHNIYGIGGIATDITERSLFNKHLMEAKSKAEMAEQLQEQFLANMSHEIRTPMNGIIGMTNILMDTSLSDDQRDFVQVIKKSSDNLLVLINDILDLSKIKAGKLRIENIDFRLRELVENIMAPFNLKIMEKGLKFGVVVDRTIPDALIGDPHRLTQILNNLLSNAIKFTEQGEINLEIKLLGSKAGAVALQFSVSDTGIGISEDKLQYVFESFTQAETGITRKFGGTGLGLSITKKLVELQQGTIGVTSKPGKGTTFTFIINYDISEQIPVKQQQAKGPENREAESLAGKKILVVEDNDTNRKVIYHMLKKVGIESAMACNGKEAVKLLEEGHRCDMVIMDLQMPEMDGFETTKYIRNNLKSNIPIIAMTASALRNEKVKCLELGMNEYLTKPFVPAELYRQLRRYLLSDNTPVSGAAEEKSAGKKTETAKPYNLSHLIEMDDADCFYEVLHLFLESTPVTLNEISQAIEENNWEQVYKLSHKLKSSLGLLQMNNLLSLVTQMESDAKGKTNLNRIPGYFEKAELLFEEIKPMIEAELRNVAELSVKN